MSFLELKIPPPLLGAVLAAAMWFAAPLGPALALPGGVTGLLVGALVLAGLGFDLMGLLAFRASRTTVNPLRPERASSLVTAGVYRVTRNPMYVGMAFLLTAWALHLGSLFTGLGPVLFVAWITRFQIRPEERILKGLFGPEFTAYCAQVRRWL